MARYRPSRIRAMFASRACRKAVMVGTALTHTKMKKYLEQLSTLKHPWVINIKQSEFKPQVFLIVVLLLFRIARMDDRL